jgi:precorrin-6B methylase 2
MGEQVKRGYYAMLRLRDRTGIPFKPEKEIAKMKISEGETILDFGCGFGSFSLPLANLLGPSGRVYALDKEILALKMLEKSADKQGLTNIETILSDYHTGLPDDSIDRVLLIGVLPR